MAKEMSMVDDILSAKYQGDPIEEDMTGVEFTPPSRQGDATDNYQAKSEVANMFKKRSYPRGASADVMFNVEKIINGLDGRSGLKTAFKRATQQIDQLKAIGDNQRAMLAQEQYMRDSFLPAVEAMMMLSPIDEVLNATTAIGKLDEFAMVNGGSGKGYTAAYIRNMYPEKQGMVKSLSDSVVRNAVREIEQLVSNDAIRSAVGKASKIKRQIDSGEHMASDEDYEIIERVVARA